MSDDLPKRLTLMQAVAWIATRDARVVQRAAWKRSDGKTDPLGTDQWAKIEACFPADGGVTLLSLDLWNCTDMPEAQIGPALICDADLDSAGGGEDVAERAVHALLTALGSGRVMATRRDQSGSRIEIEADDWEDRYLDTEPRAATELLPFRVGLRRRDLDWQAVRVARDDFLREWPAPTVVAGSEEKTLAGVAAPSVETACGETVVPVEASGGMPPLRLKPTEKAIREWFQNRVETWPLDRPAPSEEDDWQAIKGHFSTELLTRDQEFRPLRHQETPVEWRKQGRRQPWGKVKLQLAISAKLRSQN